MKKVCFYICPIGSADSPERKRTDQIFKYIIQPTALRCGYGKVIRADMEVQPGMIGSHIITRLIDSELVIADLTGHNPNAFYELAIRHAVHKPVIQIIKNGERIPFDVSQVRTISLDHTDLDSVNACKEDLTSKINALQTDPNKFDSPISQSILLRNMETSGDPEELCIATIVRLIQSMEHRFNYRFDELALEVHRDRLPLGFVGNQGDTFFPHAGHGSGSA